MALRLGIVVGEISGDNLGAQLIAALKDIYTNIKIEGIVGPKLMKLGCEQLFPMDRLAVMGFIEPLCRLPELIKMRHWLIRYFIEEPPDLFIGIDAPEFNLGLEKHIRRVGIPVVHYVSPSVWAWRRSRIRTIKEAVDLMLTLFPFEENFYKEYDVPVKFVGHPLADVIPFVIDPDVAKAKLGYRSTERIVALLPGSRNAELKHLAKLYLQAAALCYKINPQLKFIIPLVSLAHKSYIDELLKDFTLPVTTLVGNTYDVIAASEVVLVTSGTATLEVMLHKKPMVIAYKTNMITYEIVKRLVKVSYIGLPNLLADAPVATELIQKKITPERLSQKLLELLNSQEKQQTQIEKFKELHFTLKKNASKEAALAIANMLGG